MNEDLVEAFPNAALAASFVEALLCRVTPIVPVSAWDLLLQQNPGINPRQMVEKIASLTERIRLEEPHDSRIPPLARQQMDHPNFLRYVAGKMGAL